MVINPADGGVLRRDTPVVDAQIAATRSADHCARAKADSSLIRRVLEDRHRAIIGYACDTYK